MRASSARRGQDDGFGRAGRARRGEQERGAVARRAGPVTGGVADVQAGIVGEQGGPRLGEDGGAFGFGERGVEQGHGGARPPAGQQVGKGVGGALPRQGQQGAGGQARIAQRVGTRGDGGAQGKGVEKGAGGRLDQRAQRAGLHAGQGHGWPAQGSWVTSLWASGLSGPTDMGQERPGTMATS